jgi:predicted NBD/HSP70 family sugar kinase
MRKIDSIRNKNIYAVLALIGQRPLSASDLAKELGVTKSAMTSIIAQMLDNSLLVISSSCFSEPKSKTGPKKIFYEVNDAGLLGIVLFQNASIELMLVGLSKKVLYQETISNAEFVVLEHLDKIVEIINLNVKNLKLPLLNVVISTPGQVNRFSDEIRRNIKFKNLKNTNIKHYLQTNLGVPVKMYNDINLLLHGQKTLDIIASDVKDCVLIYIDQGIGGAIYNKDKLIEGELGYSGEFGLIKINEENGKQTYLDLVCSIRAIVSHFANKYTFLEIANLYEKSDLLVTEYLNITAKHIGTLISNIYNTLNFCHYFISGGIIALGKKYLEEIERNIDSSIAGVYLKYVNQEAKAIYSGALDKSVQFAYKAIAHKGGSNENNL